MTATEAVYAYNSLTEDIYGADTDGNPVSNVSKFGYLMLGLGAPISISPQSMRQSDKADRARVVSALRNLAYQINLIDS